MNVVETATGRAEDELRAHDEFYRDQFDRNPTVTLLIDPADGRIVEANAAAVAFYGYERDQLIGRPITDINGMCPADAQAVIASVLKSAGMRFEVQHTMADGTQRPVAVASMPVRLGGRVLLQSFVTDLTDQRRAEEALRESEERYRLLVDLLPDAVIVADAARVLYANASAARLFGAATADALVGQVTTERIHPDYREFSQQRAERARTTGETAPLAEMVYLRLDGTALHGESTFVPLVLAGRDALLVVIRDITAQKQAEQALRESEAKYRLLPENAKDVVWVMDAETERFEYVSPSVERLRGFTADEVLGMPLTHALPSEAATYVRALTAGRVAALLAGEGPPETFYTEQVEQTCKDGSTVWTEVISSYYRDAETGRVKVRGVSRDISERRRAEEERARLGAHLQEAQRMESVGRLAGGIAHDFNNMLSVILGNIELALHEVDPATQLHADLMEVQRAARHSAEITGQLLSYARRQAVRPAVLDLNASVEKSLSLLRPLLGEEIQLSWLPSPALWPVTVDPSQLDQVVTNLCLNARDAISGTGRLTLATANVTLDEKFCLAHEDAVPGDFVRLTVADDGTGMSPAVLAKIFEPFFTTKGVGEGSGLGLATVYGALRQNHGFITVSSEPGRGSTFDAYLPRHAVEARKTPAAGGAAAVATERGTVLLVEDEVAILRLATRALTAQGYQVLGARVPEEAIQLAAAHAGAIDLLLTDVVMPTMNGSQLADRLRASQPGMACLFMSGYSGSVLSEHGVGDEAHFIAKPFSLHALTDKVRSVIGEVEAHRKRPARGEVR